MIKKPAKQRPGVFSFMNPLSKEIWDELYKIGLPGKLILSKRKGLLGAIR